ALEFEARRVTFAALARDIDAFARGLLALGIGPGDNVALWMPSPPEWVRRPTGADQHAVAHRACRIRPGPIGLNCTHHRGSVWPGRLPCHGMRAPAVPRRWWCWFAGCTATGIAARDGDRRCANAWRARLVAQLEAGARVPDDVLHYLHLRNHGLPEGRDALSQHCSQRDRSCLPDGHYASGHHSHLPAALPSL